MRYLFLFIAFFTSSLWADKTEILAQKGERIAKVMCDMQKLQQLHPKTVQEATQLLASKEICQPLRKRQKIAVATYLVHRSSDTTITMPPPSHRTKCPICGMFVAKYPKWITIIQDNHGKRYYFDGVKDMMKFYFQHPKKTFEKIVVLDFYTLKPIDAKKAFYVIGSNIYGPMGYELIPFRTKEDAAIFKKEHYGKAILTFDQINEAYLYQE